jgi:hypothetical protein
MRQFWWGVAASVAVAAVAGAGWMLGARSAHQPVAASTPAPEERHRALVRAAMVDPTSASFRGDARSLRDNTVWCGWVNGRNRFGGMAGERRYVVFTADGDISFELDDRKDQYGGRQSDRFAGRWRLYCE